MINVGNFTGQAWNRFRDGFLRTFFLLSFVRPTPGVYADLVTVAGFKPVAATEKSLGGFDSLPLPWEAFLSFPATDAKPCENTETEPLFTEWSSLSDFAGFASFRAN